jgi:predicted dehydrogenase
MTSYAVVGTGSRATLYIDAICGTYSGHCELVAMCDTRPDAASHLDGAASVLLGDAANRALAEGHPVTVELAR